MKHILIFFSIIFLSNICYGQTIDNIIVLVVDKDSTATLSRKAEQYFAQPSIRKHITDNKYYFVQYYGQELNKEWHDTWNVRWYPTVVHLKMVDGKWYRAGVLDPKSNGFSLNNILKFLGVRAQQIIENRPRIIPGGS